MESDQIDVIDKLIVEISETEPILGIDKNLLKDLPANLKDDSYFYFLSNSKGGYTSDCFYHFFGLQGDARHNIFDWNSVELWKKYFDLTESFFIFAEDAYGNQYGYDLSRRNPIVKMLSLITGALTRAPDPFSIFVEYEIYDMDESALDIRALAFQYWKNNPQAQEPFTHVSYKIHPLLGGMVDDISNVESCDSIVNLSLSGQIITQVKSIQPGTVIKDVETDAESQTIRLIF